MATCSVHYELRLRAPSSVGYRQSNQSPSDFSIIRAAERRVVSSGQSTEVDNDRRHSDMLYNPGSQLGRSAHPLPTVFCSSFLPARYA